MRVNSLFNKYSKWFKSLTVLALVGTSLVSCQKSSAITSRNKNVLTYQDYLEDRRIMSQTLRELYENYFYSGGWKDLEATVEYGFNEYRLIRKNYRPNNIKIVVDQSTSKDKIYLIEKLIKSFNYELRQLSIPIEVININENVFLEQEFEGEKEDFPHYERSYSEMNFIGNSSALFFSDPSDCQPISSCRNEKYLFISNIIKINGLDLQLSDPYNSDFILKTLFFHEMTHALGFDDIIDSFYVGDKYLGNKIFWRNTSLSAKKYDFGKLDVDNDPYWLVINFVYDYSVHLKRGSLLFYPRHYEISSLSMSLGKFDADYLKYLYLGMEIRQTK
jgi:hypothetical protein